MIWMLITAALVMIYIEIPRLYKEKKYKEIGVFFVLLFMGLYLGMVQLYDWPFYNPFIMFYD